MQSINRRELNQRSGQIIDQVLDTGEPVEIVTRGRDSVLITPKPTSVFEQWVAQGLVKPATGRFGEGPQGSSPRSVRELIDETRGKD